MASNVADSFERDYDESLDEQDTSPDDLPDIPDIVAAFIEVRDKDGLVSYLFWLLILGLLWTFVVYVIWISVKAGIFGPMSIGIIVYSVIACSCCGCFLGRSRRPRLLAGIVTFPYWLVGRFWKFLQSRYPDVVPSFIVFRKPRYRYRSKHGDRRSAVRFPLCPLCDGILDKSRLLTGSIIYISSSVEIFTHHSAVDLKRSATTCHLCSLLSRSARFQEGPNISGTEPMNPDLEAARPSPKLRLQIWEERSSQVQKSPVLRIKLQGQLVNHEKPLTVEEVSTEQYQTGDEYPPRSTNSAFTWHLARGWISQCREHTLCEKSFFSVGEHPFIPTRLVEVIYGASNSSPPALRLIDSTSPGWVESIEYLALSYCWGSIEEEEITRLLENNIQAFKQSIILETLPLNIQHAIHVTAGLGFHYLWVDSLCIIQDLNEDMKNELGCMGDIFANAICIISGTAALSMLDGFLTEKDAFLQDCVLRTDNDSALVVRSAQSGSDSLDVLFKNYVESAKINTRGWTFQEKILSRRVLHFCKGLVLFECNAMRASEYDVDGIPYRRRTNIQIDGSLHSSIMLRRLHEQDIPTKSIKQRTEHIVPQSKAIRIMKGRRRTTTSVWETREIPNPDYKPYIQKKQELLEVCALDDIRGSFQVMIHSQGRDFNWAEKIELHQTWYDLVEQYSLRELKYPSEDKLNAFAGVISFIDSRTGWAFTAGLCRFLMPFNLLWFRADPEQSYTRPVRKHNIHIPTWSWASINGRISHRLKANQSSRTISSTPRTARPSRKDNQSGMFESTWKSDKIFCLIGKNIEISDENRKLKVYPLHSLFDPLKVTVETVFDIESAESSTSLYGLPLLEFRNAYVDPLNSAVQLHGIIITPMLELGSYERVGYFWTADEAVVKSIKDAGEMTEGILLQ